MNKDAFVDAANDFAKISTRKEWDYMLDVVMNNAPKDYRDRYLIAWEQITHDNF